MRIDAHTHVFNLQTVLTAHAITVLVNRIRDAGLPGFVADGVESLLKEWHARPVVLTEDELLGEFVDALTSTKGFKKLASSTANLPVEVTLLSDTLRRWQVAAMRNGLDRLSAWFDRGALSSSTIADVFAMLRIALRPSVTSVADELLRTMAPDDAIVALMMDITTVKDARKDEARFLQQVKQTRDAMIARPGRILPFVAVNTRRPNHLALMRDAIERHGFIGVKLYPSLGTPVDSPEMGLVFDYCLERDLPVLLHCSRGGFFESKELIDLCRPDRWADILAARPKLRVCFAHAGGVPEIITPDGPRPSSWPDMVEALMRGFDNVYTDVAFHTDQMGDPAAEARYTTWITSLLTDPALGTRVLWGTDFWLLRQSMDPELYLAWFARQFTPAQMQAMAEAAPRAYLGFSPSGAPVRQNLLGYVRFLEAQPAVGAEPPAWLTTAASAPFRVAVHDPLWSRNNIAHGLVYDHVTANLMSGPQKRLTFDEAGRLRLRQLLYWNKESVSATAFKRDCQAVALALVNKAVTRSRPTPEWETGYDPTTAVHAMRDCLMDGEKQLCDLGNALDACLLFSSERLA